MHEYTFSLRASNKGAAWPWPVPKFSIMASIVGTPTTASTAVRVAVPDAVIATAGTPTVAPTAVRVGLASCCAAADTAGTPMMSPIAVNDAVSEISLQNYCH